MIRTALRHAHTFVSTHRSFRHAGVYALLLVAIQELVARWPIDRMWLDAWVDRPWLWFLDDWTWTAACVVSLTLSLTGMVRNNWLDRIAGAIAFWPAQQFLGWWLLEADHGLVGQLGWELFGLTIELPLSLALDLAANRPSAAILLAAVYFLLVWVVLRIAFALTRDRINSAAARKLARWNLQHLAGGTPDHA